MTGPSERDPEASVVLDARSAAAEVEATRRSAYLNSGFGAPWWWNLLYSLLFGGLVGANITRNPAIMLPWFLVFAGGIAVLLRWRVRRNGVTGPRWRGMPREIKRAHLPVWGLGGLVLLVMLASWSDRFDPPALLVGVGGAAMFFVGLLWSNVLFRRATERLSASLPERT